MEHAPTIGALCGGRLAKVKGVRYGPPTWHGHADARLVRGHNDPRGSRASTNCSREGRQASHPWILCVVGARCAVARHSHASAPCTVDGPPMSPPTAVLASPTVMKVCLRLRTGDGAHRSRKGWHAQAEEEQGRACSEGGEKGGGGQGPRRLMPPPRPARQSARHQRPPLNPTRQVCQPGKRPSRRPQNGSR